MDVDSLLEQQRKYGFTSFGAEKVCGDCITEEYVGEFILDNADSSFCSYCERTDNNEGLIAANLAEVMVFIIDSLKFEWGNPDDEGVGYDSKEGGYLGVEIKDGWDFVDEVIRDEASIINEEVIEDIKEKLSDSMWCKIDPYGSPLDEEAFYIWQDFSERVKHKTRYVFYKIADSHSNTDLILEPHEILNFIGSYVEDLTLIKKVSKKLFYRARISSKNEYFKVAKDLGTQPNKSALTSNRMSPAGIPMFYSAEDKQTALVEVGYTPGPNVVASIGEFENTSDLLLLDLTSLPSLPSIFDEEERNKRTIVRFFKSFLVDFVKPIEKDNREHIDYVPTQVVTEYFRHIFKTEYGKSLDGIVYPSSKNGKKAFVLFIENDQFEEPGVANKSMILKSVSYRND